MSLYEIVAIRRARGLLIQTIGCVFFLRSSMSDALADKLGVPANRRAAFNEVVQCQGERRAKGWEVFLGKVRARSDVMARIYELRDTIGEAPSSSALVSLHNAFEPHNPQLPTEGTCVHFIGAPGFLWSILSQSRHGPGCGTALSRRRAGCST